MSFRGWQTPLIPSSPLSLHADLVLALAYALLLAARFSFV